jgi:hypothetical protein
MMARYLPDKQEFRIHSIDGRKMPESPEEHIAVLTINRA